MRDVSIRLYQTAADFALTRGIIIADTKFEFGLDDNGVMHLMDEVLTADSSRFWPADSYAPGMSPPSFDKQFVRDYLETLTDWNKAAPAPTVPEFWPTGAQAVSQASTGRKLAMDWFLMHSRRWYWMQSQVGTSWPFVGQPGLPTQQGAVNLGTVYGSGQRGLLPNGVVLPDYDRDIQKNITAHYRRLLDALIEERQSSDLPLARSSSGSTSMNRWLVTEHKKRFNGMPPDFFVAGGAAAAAGVSGLLALLTWYGGRQDQLLAPVRVVTASPPAMLKIRLLAGLSADFAALGREIEAVTTAGADWRKMAR